MNILMVCNEFPPMECGGIGIFVKELSELMVQEGHTVHVVGLYAIDRSIEETIKGVHVYRLRKMKGLFGVLCNRVLLFKKIKALVATGVDLVEVPDFEGLTAWWPKLSAPVTIRIHGSSTYFANEMGRKPSKIIKYLERKALERADAMVAVSEYAGLQTNLVFETSKPYQVVYNAVDMPMHNVRKQDYSATAKVVYVGTTISRKGIYALARTWPKVKNQFPTAELYVVGKMVTEQGEPVSTHVKRLAGDYGKSIQFTGFVSKEEVQKHFISCDVAVFPSYSETFGLAALEAMSLGVPVIYTTRSCGPEVVGKGSGVVLRDPDDSDGLADSIVNFLESEEARCKAGVNNCTSVGERYDPHEIFKKNSMFWAKTIIQWKKRRGE